MLSITGIMSAMVTVGIVSQVVRLDTGRKSNDNNNTNDKNPPPVILQTTAKIHSGNSGGLLIDR